MIGKSKVNRIQPLDIQYHCLMLKKNRIHQSRVSINYILPAHKSE